MKHEFLVCAMLFVSAVVPAQMASHSPTALATSKAPAATEVATPQSSDKVVASVNGATLTDRDLLREMYTIFPYAQQHDGGFPKAQEPAIRQGALQMIIFEELVYQEAVRRKVAISPAKVNEGEAAFRKQFKSPDEFDRYLQAEMHGSTKELRERIRRSLLIEQLLKSEVEDRATISLADLKGYYDKHPQQFEVPETFTFQSISVIPPLKPTAQQAKDAQQHAQEVLRQAAATSSYQDFGLLAEKVSEDDFRVNMGDHKAVSRDKLPPDVVKALLAIQPGHVTGLIQIESAYTIIRLNAHSPSRKKSLEEVKAGLKVELQKEKYEKLRAALDQQLRAKAKIQLG